MIFLGILSRMTSYLEPDNSRNVLFQTSPTDIHYDISTSLDTVDIEYWGSDVLQRKNKILKKIN
jgi:hypothetical protein